MKKSLLVLALLVTTALSGCGGKSKEGLHAEGVKQLNAGNPGGAIVLFKSALEKDENFVDARYQLARAYAAMGKREQAEKEFTKAFKQNPSRDEIQLELARLAIAGKKGDEAANLAGLYLAKHPDTTEALELLGVAYSLKKQYQEAETYLLQALKTSPSRHSARLELASVYVVAGAEPKAKALLEEVIQSDPKNTRASYMLATIEKGNGNSDKAMAIYQKLREYNVAETLATYKIGLIHIEKRDLDRAEALADELVKAFPDKGDGYRLKGLVSFHRKNYAESIPSLLTSLKLAPTMEGYYFLGLSYYSRGDMESALSQFRNILDNVPDSRQARLMTATVLIAQKRFEDGINEINKVLEQNNRDAIAHNLLGNIYMAKGMFDEGMRELNLATRIDPKSVDAYLKKGQFYFSRGKNSAGETELATAVQAVPDALDSRLLLASYYLRDNKNAKAMSLLKAGLTGKKDDTRIYNSMAVVLFKENKREEALQYLQKSKVLDPAFPPTYQILASFYASSGNYAKATEEYIILLRNDPANLQAMLALAALNDLQGKDSEALSFYQQAVDTKKPAAFLAQAGYLVKKKEASKALKVLDEAIRLDARNIAAMEMKGRILLAEKKTKEAIKVFGEIETQNHDAGLALKISTYVQTKDYPMALEQARKIIDKYPRSAQGYIVLSSIYEHRQDLNSAINEIKNGLRVDPQNVQAMLTMGRLYEGRKEYNLAMNSYREAVLKKPDFVPAIFAQGALLDLSGKKKEAVVKYKIVLENSPAYTPALNNLAYLYAEGYGNKEESLRLAITAFKQEPSNAGLMDTLGYALLKNNRKDDAKKVLEQAAKLLPDNPTVSYHLAMAYAETGERKKASEAVQKALAGGDFPDVAAAKTLQTELRK